MSALDRAFIRAYAKDPAPTTPRATGLTSTAVPPAAVDGDAAYESGILYRHDWRETAPAPSVVPPPHSNFARTGNTLRSRYTTVRPSDEAEPLPPTVVPQPSLPPPASDLPRYAPPPRVVPASNVAPPAPVAAPIQTTVQRLRALRNPSLNQLAERLAGSPLARLSGNDTQIVEEPRAAEPPLVEPPALEPANARPAVVESRATEPPAPVAVPTEFIAETIVSNTFQLPTEVISFQVQSTVDDAGGSTPAMFVLPAMVNLFDEAFLPAPAPEKPVEPLFRHDPPAAAINRPHFKIKPPVDEPAASIPVPTLAIEAPPKIQNDAALQPAWEVDAFQWPEVCRRLLSDAGSYFGHAGAKLTAAVEDGLHLLGVAGSARGEGCSTLSLSLAKAAADAGLKVALIDADFVDPQLCSRLGLEIDAGWNNTTDGRVPLSEGAVRSLGDSLTFFPLQRGANVALTQSAVTATLRNIQAQFQLVIVDLGPIAAGDAPLFPAGEPAPFDAVVIVRDVRRTPLAHAQSVASRLYAAGIEAVGIAENFVA